MIIPATRMALIRIGAGIVFFVVLVWFMLALDPVTTLVLVAFFVAYVLEPAVSRLTRMGLGRATAALVVLLLVFSSILGVFLIVVPAVAGEISLFAQKAPRYLIALRDTIGQLLMGLELGIPQDWDAALALIVEKGRELLPDLADPAAKVLSTVFSSLFKSTMSILSTLLFLALIPVITYYLMASFEGLKAGVTELIPPYARKLVVGKLQEIDRVLAAFVRGQLTLAFLLAVIYSTGFVIIGIDLPIVLGVLSGILWIIPYVGTIFGLVMGSLMALVKFGDLTHVFYVIGWIGLTQVAEGYVLTPRIVGEAIGLHPVVYILALMVGAHLFGFVGMLVGIPVTAVLKVLLVSAVEAYRRSSLYNDPNPETPAL